MNEDFVMMQSKVMNNSKAYTESTAFQRAMDYIADHDWELYCELIEREYNEAFGND